MSASDKDSSDHHYNTVYFKIAGGDNVSGEKIIRSVVQYLLNYLNTLIQRSLTLHSDMSYIIASISPYFIGYFLVKLNFTTKPPSSYF